MYHEVVPMGFETHIEAVGGVFEGIMKSSLWDLKPRPFTTATATLYYHEVVPMGFETPMIPPPPRPPQIMKSSLWDLKPVVSRSKTYFAPYHEVVPMGFETSSFTGPHQWSEYHEVVPMGFETLLQVDFVSRSGIMKSSLWDLKQAIDGIEVVYLPS